MSGRFEDISDMTIERRTGAWRGAITLILLSQVMAAIIGAALTRAAIFGGLGDVTIISLASILGAASAVAAGICGAKLARASNVR